MTSSSQPVYVGMGGWQLEPFNGPFYPSNPPKGFRKLEFYSQFFDAVEVNATFYNTALNQKNSYQWLNDVSGNKAFLFTVKLFKGFTHSLDARQEDVVLVRRLLEPLAAEERLGGLVMQFPYGFSFDRDRRDHLVKLSKAFGAFPLFVEVRHNSWNTPEMIDLFHENHLHLVNVDLPAIKNHMPLTSVAWGEVTYLRLMGRNAQSWDSGPNSEKTDGARYHYRYSDEELQQLFTWISEMRSKGVKTFVVFHNDPQANSVVNGFQIRHLLEPGRKFNAPGNLIQEFPELSPMVTVPKASGTLFG
ncbi:MAG: DUF72 domain-containing protein [Bacteroidota bacterium]